MDVENDGGVSPLRRSPRLKKGGRPTGSRNKNIGNARSASIALTLYKQQRIRIMQRVSKANVQHNVAPGAGGNNASAVWVGVCVERKRHLKGGKQGPDNVTILMPLGESFRLDTLT
mmetsp:Transcript_6908/g.16856  ORF Transcript_6908/g.16856 Transcript_6908/m.16856 type:complete len:116 (+) Transcript_6908:148-495(+)